MGSFFVFYSHITSKNLQICQTRLVYGGSTRKGLFEMRLQSHKIHLTSLFQTTQKSNLLNASRELRQDLSLSHTALKARVSAVLGPFTRAKAM